MLALNICANGEKRTGRKRPRAVGGIGRIKLASRKRETARERKHELFCYMPLLPSAFRSRRKVHLLRKQGKGARLWE